MDNQQQVPEKRFQDYQEVFDSEGIAIGFTLPGSDFIYKYDVDGGWVDEKGSYYDSKGILQKKLANKENSSENSEGSSDQLDQEQLDEFERMLDDEVSDPKNKKQKKHSTDNNSQQKVNQPQSYQSETKKLLQKYEKKQSIRQGLPEQLSIFFKMRSKYYYRIKPTAQKAQGLKQSNALISKIKLEAEQQSKKLIIKNKWIEAGGQFQYSGTQLDQATYDRYWYGFIKTNPQDYQKTICQIQKSEQFSLLEKKSYYALKSKFYLKKKMQQTIQGLRQLVKDKSDDDIVKITIDNLPQNFPLSFILDLCTFSGTSLDQIYSISIIDEFSAQVSMSKIGVLKFINVQGYCHDDRQYIQLTIKQEKQAKKLNKTGWYKVALQADIPYKTHTRQLHDTLALQKSKQQLVKLFTEQQQKKNGGFRFIFGAKSLKRVLMFRGNSLNILKIQLYNEQNKQKTVNT